MTNADVESISWIRTVLAFVAVGGLLALFGFALKSFKLRGFTISGTAPGARRLQVVENLLIDPRRRLVIVRCDSAEHLLLLGVNQDVVIETNLDKSSAGIQTKGGA